MGLVLDMAEVYWNMKSPAVLLGTAKWESVDKGSTMRYVCCTVALLVLAVMVGCGTQFEARTYQIGPKPKAALEMIDQITTDEIKQHPDDFQRDTPTGTPVHLMKVFEGEGVVVVRTTPQGHQRIKAALNKLRNQ